MVAYNLDQAALDSLLASENFDPHIRKAIIDYLVDQGTSTTDALQFVGGMSAVSPAAGPTDLWTTVAAGISATGDLQFGGLGKFHDTLAGGSLDTLSGGTYSAPITGSGASILGSSGNDTFLARSTGHDTIDGGAGYDQVTLNMSSANAAITTDQNGVTTITFGTGSLQVSNVEQLNFTDHNVKL